MDFIAVDLGSCIDYYIDKTIFKKISFIENLPTAKSKLLLLYIAIQVIDPRDGLSILIPIDKMCDDIFLSRDSLKKHLKILHDHAYLMKTVSYNSEIFYILNL